MSRGSIKSIDRRRTADENVVIDQVSGGVTYQTVSVSDILSEGEIGGLVKGGNSIYVDGAPLFAEEEVEVVGENTNTVTGATNSTSVTASENITDTTMDPTAGKRFLVVKEAIKTTVTVSNIQPIFSDNRGQKRGLSATITASSNIFLDTYSHVAGGQLIQALNLEKVEHGDVAAFLELEEGFVGGFIHQTGTSPSTTATFKSGFWRGSDLTYGDEAGTGNSHELILDLYLDIATISGSTITLASAPPVAFADKNFTVTALVQRTNDPTRANAGSTYQFRSGTFNQAPMSLLNGVGSSSVPLTLPTGALERPTPKEITTANLTGSQAAEVDIVRFIITYPSGLYQYHSSAGGDRHTGVGYRFELGIKRGASADFVYERLGGNLKAGSFKHTDTSADSTEDIMAHGALNKSAVSFEYLIDLTPFQPFTDFVVRVTRLTNHGTGSYVDPHWWNDSKEEKLERAASHWDGVLQAQISSATAVIQEKLSFPHTAMANIQFSSKQFQNVPKRTYDVRGIKVLVPSNYVTREENPTESTYPGQVALYKRNTSSGAIETTEQPWDGAFRSEKIYTNNPAWVFYDIMTNDRYGLGEWLKTADIDKYSLYKIARYCDELVIDGKGGKEPRFTANLYLQKATDAYKVLKDMATIFRGMLYWLGGEVVPIIDEKKSPIYNFSKANVIDGKFSYEGSGSKTRANQYIVSWNNPDSQYKLEPIIVEDRQNIIDTGRILSDKAVAFGCTSEGQAIRYGRWKLWTGINQTEVIGFKTAENAAFLMAGDIINIQDADEFDIPFSGRVNSYSESGSITLTLDKDIDIHLSTSGYTYKVAVIVPKKAAILNQDSATIGGSSYSRGDVITQARLTHGGSQATILVANETTTSLNINNALDDSNEFLSLSLKTSTIVQERSLTGSTTVSGTAYTIPSSASDGRTTIQLSAALDEDATADLTEAIWVMKQTHTSSQAETMSSAKQYKILSINENDGGEFEISAVEHYNEKFDDIEGDFNTSVDDPVVPPEPDTMPPSPLAVRILRTPRFNRPGEEVTVEWEGPASYDYLKGFEVTHNLNSDFLQETFFAPAAQLSKRFMDLPDGSYSIEVRTISTFNKRSKPTIAEASIVDVFSGDRIHGGVRRGGYCSTTLELDGSTVFFANPSYKIGPDIDDVSETELFVYASNNTNNAASKSIGIAEVSQGDWAGNKVGAGSYSGTPFAYLFYDFSNTTHASNDPIRLVSWKNDTAFQYPLFYYYDADKYAANTASIWIAISGTVAVEENSNKVVGTNTSFTSLDFQNIFKLSSSQGGRISYIESDTCLYLDRKITAAISSGTTAYVDELGIDYTNDFIMGTVSWNGSNYSLRPLLTQLPTIGDQTRGLIVTSSHPLLSYDADSDLTTSWSGADDDNRPRLEIQAINFQNPEIKVTGAGFDQTNVSAETSYTNASTRTKVIHTVGSTASPLITFAGGALDFTIEAREKDSTSLTRTVVHTISKTKDAATSAAGKKSTTGYLYYNTQTATSPQAAITSAGSAYWNNIVYTWATGVFSGGRIGTSGDTWSHIRPTPTVGTTSSKMYYVYYVITQNDATDATTTSGSGLTIDTTVYEATNFTGLVVFNGTDTVQDGAGNGLSFGSSGTTTIDGGRITTGTITAARISLSGHAVETTANNAQSTANTANSTANTANSNATSALNAANSKNQTFYSDSPPTAVTAGDLWVDTDANNQLYRASGTGNSSWVLIPAAVGGWNLNSYAIYSLASGNSTITTSGYTPAGTGNFTLNSAGSIHTPTFFVDTDGTSGFKGTVTVGSTNLDETNTLNENGPLGTSSSTVVGGGVVQLRNTNTGTGGDANASATQCVEINATTNQILIKEQNVTRVIIGKLS